MTAPQTEQPELKAGRELDALIAEKVMGLVRCQGPYHDVLSNWPNTYCYASPDNPAHGAEVRQYSTDIGAAWEVVEKCGLSVVCSEDGWYAIKPEDIVWGCVRGTDFPKVSLVGAEHEHDQFSIAYDTAPEAICRAALAALKAVQS